MTSRDFTFWLQGFFEILGETPQWNAAQIKMIKDHIGYVSMKSSFMQWLAGVLDAQLGNLTQDGVTAMIKERLQPEFTHMSAPSVPSYPSYPTQPFPSYPIQPHSPLIPQTDQPSIFVC